MKLKLLCLLIISMPLLNSCVEMVEGEGDVIKREYKLKPFHGIELDMHGKLILTQGAKNISVTTNLNLFEWIDVYVSEGILKIELRDDVDVWHFDEMLFEVSIPSTEYIKLEGTGDIVMNDSIIIDHDLTVKLEGTGDIVLNRVVANQINFSLDGSGIIRCNTVHASDVNTEIEGTGDIKLSGITGTHTIEIDGTGNIHSFNMPCDDAFINIDGSGDCHLTVLKTLDVDIEGTGSVFYKGDPETHIIKKGTGNVQKVD